MTPTADLIDRMSRLASRREQEGIYTDAALVSESAARLAKAERALEEAKAEIERMTPRYVAYDYLESPDRREMAEYRVSELERALEEAEKVIAPFFALATAVFREGMNSWREGDAGLWGFDRVTLTYGHLRAARKWMESRPSPPKVA